MKDSISTHRVLWGYPGTKSKGWEHFVTEIKTITRIKEEISSIVHLMKRRMNLHITPPNMLLGCRLAKLPDCMWSWSIPIAGIISN